MAKKKKEESAEKKEKLSAEKKAELIARVRATLSPDLQSLFDEYSSGRNPQLSKNLQDTNTDWVKVLTKWKATKDKKEGKQEKKGRTLKNPATIISKIEDEIKTNTFDSLQTAIDLCRNLIKVLEEKQEKQKQDKIDANKALIERLQAENNALEGIQDENAEN